MGRPVGKYGARPALSPVHRPRGTDAECEIQDEIGVDCSVSYVVIWGVLDRLATVMRAF